MTITPLPPIIQLKHEVDRSKEAFPGSSMTDGVIASVPSNELSSLLLRGRIRDGHDESLLTYAQADSYANIKVRRSNTGRNPLEPQIDEGHLEIVEDFTVEDGTYNEIKDFNQTIESIERRRRRLAAPLQMGAVLVSALAIGGGLSVYAKLVQYHSDKSAPQAQKELPSATEAGLLGAGAGAGTGFFYSICFAGRLARVRATHIVKKQNNDIFG
ncbi:hypothetical protein KY385_03040 [Candidatus Parcubacteria bacterium]|nr:hypothetical protein [Candidatus Parcubacteria bacterium]